LHSAGSVEEISGHFVQARCVLRHPGESQIRSRASQPFFS